MPLRLDDLKNFTCKIQLYKRNLTVAEYIFLIVLFRCFMFILRHRLTSPQKTAIINLYKQEDFQWTINLLSEKATENDISLIENLIKSCRIRKRPQDMTAAQEDLRYLLFEKNIAAALIAELNGEAVGYLFITPYSPHLRFKAGVHLEDLF